jgi:2-iminobutanoate/2-iminopropanoate deaminase
MKIIRNVPRIDALQAKAGIKNAVGFEIGGLLIFSGYAGIDLATGDITVGPFVKHAHNAIDCFEEILKAKGLSLDNVLKVKCYLKNPVEDFPVWNEVFIQRFRMPIPCRTTVGASLVAGLLELEMVASRESRLAAGDA